MAIDPSNLPIFGDPHPTDPPAPVRTACALLVLAAGVSGGQLTYFSQTGHEVTVFLVPLALTLWFALSMRAGRHWARPAAIIAGCFTLLPAAALFDGPGELGTLVVALGLLVWAARTMYLAEVRDYFEPEECPEQERV